MSQHEGGGIEATQTVRAPQGWMSVYAQHFTGKEPLLENQKLAGNKADIQQWMSIYPSRLKHTGRERKFRSYHCPQETQILVGKDGHIYKHFLYQRSSDMRQNPNSL